MKKIKRFLTIIFAVLLMFCTSVSFAGCGLIKLQYDKEYVYSDISFKKSNDLKVEDLSAFIPASVISKYKVESIKDFENMLKENIDTYFIYIQKPESSIERVYIKPKFDSIRVVEGYPYVANAYSFYLKSEGQEFRYGMFCDDNVFTSADSILDLQEFYFSNGALHYELEFNEKFSIVYNYKLNFKDWF